MLKNQSIIDRNDQIFARGKLFELVHIKQPDGRIFEIARRAPGVRLIVADKKQAKLLITREYRKELDSWDNRLPGGKVFDSLEEYDEHRKFGGDILAAAVDKAKAEGIEEAGIEAEDLSLFKKSTLGATVEWDLYVLEANRWRVASKGQQLEAGEQIEANNWVSYKKAKELILNGDIQEERVAFILLQWLNLQRVKL